MNWCKDNNTLILETGQKITFDFPIKGVDSNSCLTYIGVKLDVPLEQSTEDNFYCISKENGKIEANYAIGCPTPPNYLNLNNKIAPVKCSMDWGKEAETLLIQGKKTVTFEYPVGMIFEAYGVLLVVLDFPPKESMSDNVFAVSKEGEILWQIEPIPKSFPCPTNRYTSIGDSSVNGIVVAWNFNCTNVYVDVRTGKIVDTEFTK